MVLSRPLHAFLKYTPDFLFIRGCTPLHIAACSGRVEVWKSLIEANADMAARDKCVVTFFAMIAMYARVAARPSRVCTSLQAGRNPPHCCHYQE